MKKAIIIIISILLVITAGSIFALNKLGNEVIDTLIDSEIASLEQTGNDITGLGGDQTTPDESAQSEETQNNTPIDNKAIDNGTSADNTNTSNKEDIKSKTNNSVKKKVITVKQVQEIKDQVTVTDKMTAATLVMKRLSSDDISTLKELMSGGLTPQKKKEAVKIAYSRFTADEIVQIKELYHKYMK